MYLLDIEVEVPIDPDDDDYDEDSDDNTVRETITVELENCPNKANHDHNDLNTGSYQGLDTYYDDDDEWWVECDRCQMQGPHAYTEKAAVDLWNLMVSGMSESQTKIDSDPSHPDKMVFGAFLKVVKGDRAVAAYLLWKFLLEPDRDTMSTDKMLDWVVALCQKSGYEYDVSLWR